jgi:hypothetical protein
MDNAGCNSCFWGEWCAHQFSLGTLLNSCIDTSNTFSTIESYWAAMEYSCWASQVDQSSSIAIHATSCCIPSNGNHE